jgi:hypothetical protein
LRKCFSLPGKDYDMITLLIPVLTILATWLTARVISRAAVKHPEQFTEPLGQLLETGLSPEQTQNLLPVVETHVDVFLREKLPASMPVFKMFIGDSTIKMVKDVFMKELDELLPILIKESNPAGIIKSSLTQKKLEKVFKPALRKAELAGLLFGVVAGGLQLILLLFR